MLDIKFIRENPQQALKGMQKRGQNIQMDDILRLDNERKAVIEKTEQLRLIRNKESENIGKMKRQGTEPPESLVREINDIRENIQKNEKILSEIEKKLEDALLFMPNIVDDSVPEGKDSDDNKIVRSIGEPKKFSFKPKHHCEIGEKLGILDFPSASKI